MSRATLGWIVLGWVGFALLPWYGFDALCGTDPRRLLRQRIGPRSRISWSLVASADPRAARHGPACRSSGPTADSKGTGSSHRDFSASASSSFKGFAIGLNGWTLDILKSLFGEPGPSQAGMGYGAALTATAFLIVLCHGLAARGWCRGDAFVDLVHRRRHRADRRLRLLPGLHDPGERLCRQQRQLRAGGVRHEIPRPVDLGSRLPVERPALRRGLEHAVPRPARRRRHHGSRPGLRADRDAHRASASRSSCA